MRTIRLVAVVVLAVAAILINVATAFAFSWDDDIPKILPDLADFKQYYYLWDCDNDGDIDCYTKVLYRPTNPLCVFVRRTELEELPVKGSAFLDTLRVPPTIIWTECPCKMSLASLPAFTPTLPSTMEKPPSEPPTPPTETPSAVGPVKFGDARLQRAGFIKCVSFTNRDYVDLIIRLPDQEKWKFLPRVQVDTGADVTVLPSWIGQLLGLDLQDCETTTVSGIGGTATVYVAELVMGLVHLGGAEEDFDGYILTSDGEPFSFKALVYFLPGEEHKETFLLGQKDVFDHLSFSFDGDILAIRPR